MAGASADMPYGTKEFFDTGKTDTDSEIISRLFSFRDPASFQSEG